RRERIVKLLYAIVVMVKQNVLLFLNGNKLIEPVPERCLGDCFYRWHQLRLFIENPDKYLDEYQQAKQYYEFQRNGTHQHVKIKGWNSTYRPCIPIHMRCLFSGILRKG